ncbi:hypothetical protein M409DRAFT_49798 [Zasmidium cellare ATCC 36951]|uniref:Uncharacterized protein n=1 Tax=Zasmidium cellare ATCC 36951 TaxID=1080233 RepID=A0A6A6D4N9_ZASCE|nr:uncharacterized protein M409DRAFT_49798 [Zasmidium cellare ATCC 36951]KAF2173340.1 hypothetical protein M409DRAFT_49798 [Zasmidium cellare ATCC 36951]
MSSVRQDLAVENIPTTNTTLPTTNDLPDSRQTRKDIQVQLQYLKDDPIYREQKPLQITPNFLDKENKTNVKLSPGHPETIQDVRGQERDFTLDRNGFKYVHAPTKFKDWSSQPKIAEEYLPQLETLLRKEVDGCDEIIFYDARIRHADDAGLRVEGLSYNPFAKQVHTDNTEKSVLMKIRNLTEMKADYLLSGRARIINIWRPIKHPVYDCGLAIADGGKLKTDDVIECDRHRQDTGEFWDTMGVIKYRPGFEWYYMSYQDEPDVLLFKNHDTATDVDARTCLHTAFDLPPDTVPAGSPTRESIEVRALIFTYPMNSSRPSGSWSMPHPLAESLKQSHLKSVDVEHSITDRLRTDIDESHEIKDAVLLLRRQEIKRLEAIEQALVVEKDILANELDTAKKQVEIQTGHSEALQLQVQELTQQLKQHQPELRNQVQSLSAELVDARLQLEHLQKSAASQSSLGIEPDERTILLQQLERANMEVERWKAEAMGIGSEAVSRAWQGSVDEAIRREREKDAFVIDSLRAEIDNLKADRNTSSEQ